MFTGLIESLGTIVDLTLTGTSLCLKIEADEIFSQSESSAKIPENGLKMGDSIAINGICLTATKVEPRMIGHTLPFFEVTAIQETLGKTTLGSLIDRKEGNVRVNLERAVTLETRLGGHLVQGHVDGIAVIREIRDVNGSWEFSFELPQEMARYVIPKGSIAIDGVSLTVANVAQTSVCATIAIIPHTFYHTNFQFLKIGDVVNVELDIIAKMVERLVKPYLP
jgi:riboflavin synthase